MLFVSPLGVYIFNIFVAHILCDVYFYMIFTLSRYMGSMMSASENMALQMFGDIALIYLTI